MCTEASGSTFAHRQLLFFVFGRHVTYSGKQPYMSASSHCVDHDICFRSSRSHSVRYNHTLLPVSSRHSVSSHTTTSRRSCTSHACVLMYLTAKLADILAAIMQVYSSYCLLNLPTKCISRRVVQQCIRQQQFQLQESACQAKMQQDLQRATACKVQYEQPFIYERQALTEERLRR